MEIVIALGILCVVVLLGFAALVYLKHSQDRALLKDLLEARQDIVLGRQKSELAAEVCSKSANSVHADLKAMTEKFQTIASDAEKAKIAAETILREYELNGIPMGYKRGNDYDAVEGM
jgi:hypothetical protein